MTEKHSIYRCTECDFNTEFHARAVEHRFTTGHFLRRWIREFKSKSIRFGKYKNREGMDAVQKGLRKSQ